MKHRRSNTENPPPIFVHQELSLKEFAGRLYALRYARKWSQENLAIAAEMDTTNISHYERAAHWPSVAGVARLAKCLGVSIDELIGVER